MQMSQMKVLDGSSVRDCLRPRRLVGGGSDDEPTFSELARAADLGGSGAVAVK